MALSGKTNVVSFATSGAFQVWIEWNATQNVSANTTTVNATMYVKSIFSGSGFTSNSCTMAIAIDGVTPGLVTKAVNINNIQTIAVYSYSRTVPHNADGSKSVLISGQFSANIKGWPRVDTTGSFGLNKIPRAYTFITSTNTCSMDSPLTIKVENNGSGLQARLYFNFGNKNLLLNGTMPIGTDYNYTFKASDWADQIPNSTSGSGSLRIETWNGGTKIGEQKKTLTLTYPTGTAYSPVITGFSATEAITTTASVTGSNTIFVQGLTNFRLKTDTTTAHGSPIKKFEWNVNGTVVSNIGLTLDINLAKTNVGTGTALPVTVSVTDGRGRKTTKSGYTINIQAYQPPRLTNFSAKRKTSPNTTVDIVKAVAISSIKNGTTEKNTYTVTTKYKKSVDTTWTTAKTETNTSGNLSITDLAINSSYDIQVIVTDKFNTITVDGIVSTTEVLFHLFKDVGVGINKMFEEGHGVLDVGGMIWMNSRSLLDFFYPVGSIYTSTNSANPSTWMGGTWERWGNGRAVVGVNESDTDFATPNKTGGAKSVQLHEGNMPNYVLVRASGGRGGGANGGTPVASGWRNGASFDLGRPYGGVDKVDIVNPYQTAYMWRRTA